ncbi:hypothetical protein GOEFS_039_00350 [Gordonia effusa NBRC 100432]|uniref:Uncharacterized protein n=1 Tax=Gordonia effusa NBRC 100432 TaxID=1077974 RepID=H0QYA0_9ACTN|nr:hypothetical protein [Gordonia effusa]GAB17801.1 hypothetical protein GOEFS_039_00350 [Gordonia effusa NBRC 100432]
MKKGRSLIREFENRVAAQLSDQLVEVSKFRPIENGRLEIDISEGYKVRISLHVDLGVEDRSDAVFAEVNTILSLISARAGELFREDAYSSGQVWIAGLGALVVSPDRWKIAIDEESGQITDLERAHRYALAVDSAFQRICDEVPTLDALVEAMLRDDEPPWAFPGMFGLLATCVVGRVDEGYALYRKYFETKLVGSDESQLAAANGAAMILTTFDRPELGDELVALIEGRVRQRRLEAEKAEADRRARVAANAERDKSRVVKPLTVKNRLPKPGKG